MYKLTGLYPPNGGKRFIASLDPYSGIERPTVRHIVTLARSIDVKRVYVPRKRFDVPKIEGLSVMARLQANATHAADLQTRMEEFRANSGMRYERKLTSVTDLERDAASTSKMDFRLDVAVPTANKLVRMGAHARSFHKRER